MKIADEHYMERCLELARLGAGYVSPNPLVGCVIVYNDEIIGEGWHRQYGGPHAEVNAVNDVSDPSLLKHATVYVNLEPCSHFGNTPPCADLLVSHQVNKVVIAAVDDNPEVSGKGIRRLEENNIEVVTGILQSKARDLNRYFYTYHNRKRPFVFLKWAQSSDGFFAPENGSQWLSNAATKRLTHRFRHDIDAILIGNKTARVDDPQLTDRFWNGHDPIRVVLDSANTLPGSLKLFNGDGRVVVLHHAESVPSGSGAEFVKMNANKFHPKDILKILYDKKISSVLIEGGAVTIEQFIQADLWDEAVIYTSPNELGSGIVAPAIEGKTIDTLDLGDNKLEHISR